MTYYITQEVTSETCSIPHSYCGCLTTCTNPTITSTNQQQILFTRSRKKNKYKIINLELLLGGYQRANRPPMLATCDEFMNNCKNILQYKRRQEKMKN